MDLSTLLSEEFVEFSKKIAVLHENKKELNAEMKKLFDEHKMSIKKIDEEAAQLQKEFDQWVQESK